MKTANIKRRMPKLLTGRYLFTCAILFLLSLLLLFLHGLYGSLKPYTIDRPYFAAYSLLKFSRGAIEKLPERFKKIPLQNPYITRFNMEPSSPIDEDILRQAAINMSAAYPGSEDFYKKFIIKNAHIEYLDAETMQISTIYADPAIAKAATQQIACAYVSEYKKLREKISQEYDSERSAAVLKKEALEKSLAELKAGVESLQNDLSVFLKENPAFSKCKINIDPITKQIKKDAVIKTAIEKEYSGPKKEFDKIQKALEQKQKLISQIAEVKEWGQEVSLNLLAKTFPQYRAYADMLKKFVGQKNAVAKLESRGFTSEHPQYKTEFIKLQQVKNEADILIKKGAGDIMAEIKKLEDEQKKLNFMPDKDIDAKIQRYYSLQENLLEKKNALDNKQKDYNLYMSEVKKTPPKMDFEVEIISDASLRGGVVYYNKILGIGYRLWGLILKVLAGLSFIALGLALILSIKRGLSSAKRTATQ